MKQKWSEEKIERLEREGRGKGAGADYRPWIQVSDFSSLGKSRRVFSRKTGRVHHLLSDIEWHMFLLLEFSPRVLDIREQFPLPRSESSTSVNSFRCHDRRRSPLQQNARSSIRSTREQESRRS